MSRPTMTRQAMAARIVEQVNAEAPERIEGIKVIDAASNGLTANWTTGDYWPPAAKGGLTEIILYGVVNDLRHEFDIEG